MSTHSIIAVKTTSGVRAIYCHWDGYLGHVGKTLLEHYNSQSRAEQLIELGNLSGLAPIIEPVPTAVHSFDQPQKNVCVAYDRDRGESGHSSRMFPNVNEMCWYWDEPYYYMWTSEGWQVKIGSGVWLNLADAIESTVKN